MQGVACVLNHDAYVRSGYEALYYQFADELYL